MTSIQSQIEDGNQWFELPYILALYHATLNDVEQIQYWLKKAVDLGLSQAFRFNHPILDAMPAFDKEPFVIELEKRLTKQRKEVLNTERLL